METFQYKIVADPEIFQQNRLPAHSDHQYFGSAEAAEKGEPDLKMNLNGTWKISYADTYAKAEKSFFSVSHDCSDWDEIPVPAHIQMHGYDVPQYANTQYPWDASDEILPGQIPERFNPTADYVRFFDLPDFMVGKPVYISFQGVESGFALWLNGHYVGYSEDSFTPSEFDLTPYVQEKGNKLAVQVFKWTAGSWCEDQDFLRFSGIFRDVYLYTFPQVHIRDLKIKTILDDSFENADLHLELKATAKGTVTVMLTKGDVIVCDGAFPMDEDCSIDIPVGHPLLWSAEAPNLYDLQLTVSDEEGNYQETITEKVGFRRFELKDHIMTLNGQRIVFRGVNRHEFSARSGRVMNEDELRQDLVTMKQNNINAIRTCHYPNNTLLYRLCDEYGLYIIDETNLETHGTWDAIIRGLKDLDFAVPGNRPEYQELILDRGRSMFERDKNHPCILIWSLGNESYGGKDFYVFDQAFHQWDDTRLTHYEGVTRDRRYPETSDIESTMYFPVTEIKAYLAEHRDKPYISCEYAHAMGNSTGALWKYTDLAEEEPLYQGGFIWDYIDQSLTLTDRYGRTYQGYGGDFGDRPCDFSFSGNGIVYGDDRMPSPKMQEVKYDYQAIRISFKENAAVISNRNLFTNTDAYDCFVTMKQEGKLVKSLQCECSIAPLSAGRLVIPFDIPEDGKEYVVTVSFCLKEDTIWAKAGHEVAWGQKTFGSYVHTQVNEGGMDIVHGLNNIGVYGEHFSAIFSGLHGGLVSYKYDGREMIKRMPKPNFWRAMTENDMANLLPFRAGQWKAASTYVTHKENDGLTWRPYEIEEAEGTIRITYTLHLATRPMSDCRLSYLVYPDGEIRVSLEMDASAVDQELPAFEVLMTMDADFDQLTWYGLGPDETYVDRNHAKLDVYSNQVADNVARYLVPQECGNKEQVRWARLTDADGHGLAFDVNGLGFSALPYMPQEMENAQHTNELPPVLNTIVRIGHQMGVGGDDTWGAKTHPEFMLDPTKPMKIEFGFKGL